MPDEKFFEAEADIIAPIVHNLLGMRRAARDAFNRHSRDKLQEVQKLHAAVTKNIADASHQVKSLVARKPGAEKEVLPLMEKVLSHLGEINAYLGSLADPIQKKIKGNILFSDKAVAQSNYLLDQHGGMIRSLLDIIRTDNDFLKGYVKTEARNLVQASNDYATEHQDRLIEGLCTPQAAPIFLAILNRMRTIGQHEGELAELLAKRP